MNFNKKHLSLLFGVLLIFPSSAFNLEQNEFVPLSRSANYRDYEGFQLYIQSLDSLTSSGLGFLRLPGLLKKHDLEKSGHGYLVISFYPYADVEIDGKKYGEAPPCLAAKLPEGKHEIRFILSKLNREETMEIDVKRGEIKRIHGKLKSQDQIRAKTTFKNKH